MRLEIRFTINKTRSLSSLSSSSSWTASTGSTVFRWSSPRHRSKAVKPGRFSASHLRNPLADISTSDSASVLGGSERMEVQARKFYSQRNMYLCGFTLFLSLILNRTYVMILDVLRLEEKVKRYEGDPKTQGKESEKLSQAGGAGEIGKLKNQLAQKDRDMETLKKQCEGLQREYNSLSDQLAQTNSDSTTKKDR